MTYPRYSALIAAIFKSSIIANFSGILLTKHQLTCLTIPYTHNTVNAAFKYIMNKDFTFLKIHSAQIKLQSRNQNFEGFQRVTQSVFKTGKHVIDF